MQQSNVIFGALLIAYIVFITARGELGTYIQLLRGGGMQPASASGSGTTASSGLSGLANLTGLFSGDQTSQTSVSSNNSVLSAASEFFQ